MSTLINKNIVVAGHRTSMRLEPEMWDALAEICNREKSSIKDICTLIDSSRGSTSLTSAVRVFILAYFRFAAANNNVQFRPKQAVDGTTSYTPQSGTLAQPTQPVGLSDIVQRIFS